MFIKHAKVFKPNTTKAVDNNNQKKAINSSNSNSSNKLTIQNSITLKVRFLMAVTNGEIGQVDDAGVIVSLKEFKAHFNDIKSDYINSFLPAAQ